MAVNGVPIFYIEKSLFLGAINHCFANKSANRSLILYISYHSCFYHFRVVTGSSGKFTTSSSGKSLQSKRYNWYFPSNMTHKAKLILFCGQQPSLFPLITQHAFLLKCVMYEMYKINRILPNAPSNDHIPFQGRKNKQIKLISFQQKLNFVIQTDIKYHFIESSANILSDTTVQQYSKM